MDIVKHEGYALIPSYITPKEINRLRSLEKSFNFFDAGVGKFRQLAPRLRISEIARVARDDDTEPMYEKFIALADVLTKLSRQDLSVFGERLRIYEDLHELFQYTIYRGEVEGHYDWHRDTNNKEGMTPRRLTLVLQLSNPDEYEGGLLQLGEDRNPDTAINIERQKGLIVAFPSWSSHRVTPVTAGTRRSLVLWFSGY